MNATWACWVRLNITCDMLENQTATMAQSSNQQISRLDIKRVCLVKSLPARSAYFVNQLGLLQVLAFIPCDSLRVEDSFDTRFMSVLARWLFTPEVFGAYLAFMAAVDLWEARIPTYCTFSVTHTDYPRSAEGAIKDCPGVETATSKWDQTFFHQIGVTYIVPSNVHSSSQSSLFSPKLLHVLGGLGASNRR